MTRKDGVDLIRAILLGTVAALLVIVCASMLCALLLSRRIAPEAASTVMTMAICALGAVTGCILAQKLAGRARLPVSLATAAVMLAIMGAAHTLINQGPVRSWGSLLIALAAAVGTALIGAGKRR